MTAEKAIEILSTTAEQGTFTFNQEFRDALRLGREALKRIKDNRREYRVWHRSSEGLLPGETEG